MVFPLYVWRLTKLNIIVDEEVCKVFSEDLLISKKTALQCFLKTSEESILYYS